MIEKESLKINKLELEQVPIEQAWQLFRDLLQVQRGVSTREKPALAQARGLA